ncbi:MAG: AIR synthase family protein [Thermofilaceae archaeon]
MSGKLPPDLLTKYVLSRVGVPDPDVIVGPTIGEDAAVIDLGGGRVLVAHVDPITGAVESMGWLAVHIACNDVAVRGVKPRWLLSVLYLPEGANPELVDRITSQIDEAAREVGAMVVGGHSEFTPGLSRPLISMTALGVAEKGRVVTTSGAREGDAVVMTKTVAVEGTAILATDFGSVLRSKGVPDEILERGRQFLRRVSVVREALALAEAQLASSMHDPTEGGLLGGLAEVAYASRRTIEVWEERVPMAEETAIMTRALGLDPLKLISSGVLVATIPQDRVGEALKILEKLGVRATVIGRVTEFTGHYVVLHRRSGYVEKLEDFYVRDELNTAWERWGEQLR